MDTQAILTNTIWAIDPTHSHIQFKVKHLLISNVIGSFKQFEATVETEGTDFSTAQITFTAQTSSIDTGNEQRDGHLRSADFFNSELYPEMSFVSTKISKKDENEFDLTGNLTFLNVTRPVTLKVSFSGLMTDPYGNTKAGLEVSGKIDRKEWGLSWNTPLDAGGFLLSDSVELLCDVQLVPKV